MTLRRRMATVVCSVDVTTACNSTFKQLSTSSTLSSGRSPRAPSQGTAFLTGNLSALVLVLLGTIVRTSLGDHQVGCRVTRLVTVNCRVPGFKCLSGVVSPGFATVGCELSTWLEIVDPMTCMFLAVPRCGSQTLFFKAEAATSLVARTCSCVLVEKQGYVGFASFLRCGAVLVFQQASNLGRMGATSLDAPFLTIFTR